MTQNMIGRVAIALALVSGIGFLVVALHEFDYAHSHPFAYGPAKVIAWAALAGAALAGSVALLGYALARGRQPTTNHKNQAKDRR